MLPNGMLGPSNTATNTFLINETFCYVKNHSKIRYKIVLPTKLMLTFSGIHCVIAEKTKLFVTIAVT
jgi:hypothetical protein